MLIILIMYSIVSEEIQHSSTIDVLVCTMYHTCIQPNISLTFILLRKLKKGNESVVDFFPMIPQREHLTCHTVYHCQGLVGHIMDLLCPTFVSLYM